MKKTSTLNFLRIIAIVLLLAGAVCSLILMFNAGRNQSSVVLIALFTIWVLSPFVVLLIMNFIAKRWSIDTRKTLYLLMLFITLVSLVNYSGALSMPGTKPAFKFLIVPLISWLFIGIFILIAASRSRKASRRSNNDNT